MRRLGRAEIGFLAMAGCSAQRHRAEPSTHADVDASMQSATAMSDDGSGGHALDAAPPLTVVMTDAMSSPSPDASVDTPAANALVGLYDNAQGVPLVRMLDGARTNIDIEIYEMFDLSVHEALRRALKRGVRVRVVEEPEPVGEACKPFAAASKADEKTCADLKQLVNEVRSAGGRYVPFAKAALCSDPSACVEHGKLVLTDGNLALVSTGNFNASNLCDANEAPMTCNRDYSVITDASVIVQTLTRVFEADLAGSTYDLGALLDGSARAVLTVSPLSQQPLADFLRSATRSISIENQYLHDATLNAALVERAKAGVKVEVTVESFCAFGKPNSSDVKQETSIYQAFDAAGIDTRIFTARVQVAGHAGYLHAKSIVVDGERAWVGSVNGSTQATTKNREFGVFFSRPDWVHALDAWMQADHENPNTESWQESLKCAKDM